MNTLEYRFHTGARTALMIVAVLCIFLIVAAPIGLWVLLRSRGAVVRISPADVFARGLYTSTTFQFAEIERIGLLEVRVVARGIGGMLAKQRMGGDKAIHVVVKTRAGKTCKIGVSQYENCPDIIAQISARARRPYEHLTSGLVGMKWPAPAV